MDSEQTKTLKALQYAIQMEIEGKDYYVKASQKCGVKAGKELFEWLAGQEDWHRQKFEQIYEAVKNRKAWPDIKISAGDKNAPATIFSQITKATYCEVKEPTAELSAIDGAMELENKTYDYYKKQAADAVYEAQKGFYTTLSGEERKHYLALVDYREYIINPEGWFTKMEHHTLDGG
jgi:rubrerythrin